jgi:hypothetical protein
MAVPAALQRHDPLPAMTGDLGALALYAGQSAGLIRNEDTARTGLIMRNSATALTDTRLALSLD